MMKLKTNCEILEPWCKFTPLDLRLPWRLNLFQNERADTLESVGPSTAEVIESIAQNL